MKKILALVLALTLCLGLSVSGFATEETQNPTIETTEETGDYSISITNAIAGQTYKAYKIFDAIDGTPADAVEGTPRMISYTINSTSPWFNIVKAYTVNGYTPDPENTATCIDTGYVVLTQINGTTEWSVTTSSHLEAEGINKKDEAAAFAEYLADELAKDTQGTLKPTGYAVATASESTEQTNAATATISGIPAGYYFVNTTLGSLTSLDTVTGVNQAIEEKNTEPTVDKEVQEDSKVSDEGNGWGNENTAELGQVVNFRSTITVEKGAAKSIVLHDTMTNGLTFINATEGDDAQNNLKVMVGGENIAATSGETKNWELKVNPNTGDSCTFDVVFDDAFIAGLIEKSSQDNNKVEIVVTYSARVNENAVIGGDGNKNETHLSYGDESKVTSITDTTTTYVYEFKVFKYTDGTEGDAALKGAKFVLYYTDAERTNHYAVTKAKEASDSTQVLTGWTTHLDDANAGSGEVNATVFTSGEDGFIKIEGLDAGTYYLYETEAPQGYNRLDTPIQVTISEPSEADVNGGTVTPAPETGKEVTYADGNVISNVVKVVNKSGTELPSTGGIGTTIFYVVGGILMLGAVILLITKKKMGSKQ